MLRTITDKSILLIDEDTLVTWAEFADADAGADADFVNHIKEVLEEHGAIFVGGGATAQFSIKLVTLQ